MGILKFENWEAKVENQRIKSQEPAADADGATPIVREMFCKAETGHDERVPGMRVSSSLVQGFSNLKIERGQI